MLKKRLIFALLWDQGHFCLSRNFRLQRVGDLAWLTEKYNFASVANSIDELVLIDVSRSERQSDRFIETVSVLASSFHMPLSVGGGVTSINAVDSLLRAGCDKVVLNSAFHSDAEHLVLMRETYGKQCLVASVDVRKDGGDYFVFAENGTRSVGPLAIHIERHVAPFAGEIIINSIDRDGTGQGLDFGTLVGVPGNCESQIVIMGGVGTPGHIVEALEDSRVDAVVTANLLNFIGDGLREARLACGQAGIALPLRVPSDSVK